VISKRVYEMFANVLDGRIGGKALKGETVLMPDRKPTRHNCKEVKDCKPKPINSFRNHRRQISIFTPGEFSK